MGTLWRSRKKLRESIDMWFGVVTGVGCGMGVLEEVHVPKGKGYGKEFGILFPVALEA